MVRRPKVGSTAGMVIAVVSGIAIVVALGGLAVAMMVLPIREARLLFQLPATGVFVVAALLFKRYGRPYYTGITAAGRRRLAPRADVDSSARLLRVFGWRASWLAVLSFLALAGFVVTGVVFGDLDWDGRLHPLMVPLGIVFVSGVLGLPWSIINAIGWRRRYRAVSVTGWRAGTAEVRRGVNFNNMPEMAVTFADGHARLQAVTSSHGATMFIGAGPTPVRVGGIGRYQVVLFPHGRWRQGTHAVPVKAKT